MLDTLLRIGEWQARGKGEWDRFLDRPKVISADKKGNEITPHILAIVFDLDNMKVIIDREYLREYDERQIETLKALKIQGGNNKAVYATVPAGKIIQLYKTFFGKENDNTTEGELLSAMRKEAPSLLTNAFETLLHNIFLLKHDFLQQATVINEKSGNHEINFKAFELKLQLNKNETVQLVYVAIKSSALGSDQIQPFAGITEYLEFLKRKYFPQQEDAPDQEGSKKEAVCYASGSYCTDVQELDLADRYSLNKMFVTETRNYASQFHKDNFPKNYQVSRENQAKLDLASKFLLHSGYKIRIANIDHVVMPQFRKKDKIDLDMALRGIKAKSDILFSQDIFEDAINDLEDETDSIFWINLIAFESDGNFFKSTEIIKDISNTHFSKVLDAFRATHWHFRKFNFVDWTSIMTEYGTSGRLYNFNTVYGLIPLRKEKEKKNQALHLFKGILENRKIERKKLFIHFRELILCNYYERYTSFTNIAKSSKDYFTKTIRDCVYKYFAFINVLKLLQLIDMEEPEIPPIAATNKYDQAIAEFFTQMKLTQPQQAMFYLGRILNTVEYIQKEKRKTVIEKVNFHGMDRRDIQQLRTGLLEKAKQYGKINKIRLMDKRFAELFDFNNWNLDPNESVFFLLSGYSFGPGSLSSADEEDQRPELD